MKTIRSTILPNMHILMHSITDSGFPDHHRESVFRYRGIRNIEFARACVADCLKRGECPIASHLLYTQPGILYDEIPLERELGIHAGFEWAKHADKTVVYINRGYSKGMWAGINNAK